MADPMTENPLIGEARALAAGEIALPELFALGGRILKATPPEGVPVQRVAVLGALTTDLLARAVAVGVAQEGVFPVLYQAPFGAYVQEVLDPASGLQRFRPDLVLLAPDARELVDALPLDADAEAVQAAIARKVALFEQLWAALAALPDCRVLQHGLVPPAPRYTGMAERLAPASPANQVRALNDALFAAGRGRVHFVDLDRLAAELGLARWANERMFHSAKLSFDPDCLPAWLPVFRAAWRNACARPKKVLVLDLDNTLWGGVIGDDGVEGIVLGPGSARGEAFHAWGGYVAALRARGVVLAVCSKNAPEIAASAFAHAHAALKREHFAAFECSWEDKARGLRRIAAELNLGIDSFVFADDNAAECELVRRELPDVSVVHLGTEPGLFIAKLEAGHWFDMDALTAADLGRAQSYEARRQAAEEAAQSADLGTYLAGLAMRGKLAEAAQAELARLAQMEQKTNQFNVTTRRYEQSALAALMARDDAVVLSFSLADKFADHGLVSSLVAVQEGEAMRIDSWLMSCRVFSRSAEQFMLRGLIAMARARGARTIIGEYRPTAKNGVVADLYERLGFAPAGEGLFRLDLTGFDPAVLETAIVAGAEEAQPVAA
jgi:FkbH-like protein